MIFSKVADPIAMANTEAASESTESIEQTELCERSSIMRSKLRGGIGDNNLADVDSSL